VKARPRRIENRVADEINRALDVYGIPLTRRIPVLGRTGPDLEPIQVLDLAVDVKSRLSVPKGMLAHDRVISTGSMVGVRLCRLPDLLEGSFVPGALVSSSTIVLDWLSHMDGWVKENMEDGIAAIVLHRPGTHVRNATLVIFEKDWSRLNDKYRRHVNDL
jgi:hypothetical protein